MKTPRVVIVGAGPAGLMVAAQLKDTPASIVLVDHKPAVARKLLVAGHGGFNLTHSEPLPAFLEHYDRPFIRECVRRFTPDDFREWLRTIGIETFIGSSGKVFPVAPTKPVEVLNAWLQAVESPRVEWKLRTRLVDFDERSVTLSSAGETEQLPYDYLVFALGGASWKKTGADGSWLDLFARRGIPVVPFGASNSGVELGDPSWLPAFEGTILKNIRLSAGETSVPGDVVITTYGLEGKPVYACNRALREADFLGLTIDFKPQFSVEQVEAALRSAKTIREGLQRLKLPKAVYAWLKAEVSKEVFTDAAALARTLKAFQPHIRGFRPIDEVISTVGGVAMEAVNENGELTAFPKVYCCGEMLDWDAPTGGYLLQAAASSGVFVARKIAGML